MNPVAAPMYAEQCPLDYLESENGLTFVNRIGEDCPRYLGWQMVECVKDRSYAREITRDSTTRPWVVCGMKRRPAFLFLLARMHRDSDTYP